MKKVKQTKAIVYLMITIINLLAVSVYAETSQTVNFQGVFKQAQDLSHPDTSFYEKFEIDGDHYLGSIRFDYFTYLTSFQVYKWNNTSFEEYQLLSFELMASDLKVFTHNEKTYFVATGMEKMLVYQWDQGQFIEYQDLTIPTTYMPSLFFIIKELPYVAISSIDDNLYIFEWDSTTGFKQKQYFKVPSAKVVYLSVNGNSYLMAYENSITLKLYKWMGTIFRPSNDFIVPEENVFFSNQFSYEEKEYFVFTNFGIYSENDIYSYGVYQLENQTFSEIFKANLTTYADLSNVEINDHIFLVTSMSNKIEIYLWNNSEYEIFETINCMYPCFAAKMFSINQELYAVTRYAEEFDDTNPDKPLAAGIYVYKKEEESAGADLNDIICAIQILSGKQCDYQGDDVLSDQIIDLKDILFHLHKIAN